MSFVFVFVCESRTAPVCHIQAGLVPGLTGAELSNIVGIRNQASCPEQRV